MKLNADKFEPDSVESIVDLFQRIEIMDVGAACIAETPVYKKLIDRQVGHLHAFEGDQRQIEKIKAVYAEAATVYPQFLFDGTEQTVYLAAEASGMTSLLRPRAEALRFFNGFEMFGQVLETPRISTSRLDDVSDIPHIDFLKMDIQGAELTVMKNGQQTLRECVAMQLEVSYIALYEDQPCFGEVDVWLRTQGLVPHCFLDVKRWSIAPTIRDNNFRIPFNQLLESDVVYIRDPLTVKTWTSDQVKKLAVLAHHALHSVDLVVYLILELIRRGELEASSHHRYLATLNKQAA